LQAALKQRYGVNARLIAGHGGAFLVKVNGMTVFDRLQSRRFPDEREIFSGIDKLTD
jgi:selT/selW/selH-like putative selenoprotein